MEAILTNIEHPKTLEEFVSATTPPRSKETFDKVVAALEPQRAFVEAHLKMYTNAQENWHRWATNVWNAMPVELVKAVAKIFTDASELAQQNKALSERLAKAEAELTALKANASENEKPAAETPAKTTKKVKEPK